ncbi:hypothetical protein ACFL96_17620, partial [Thermoproteota archaeon]
MKKRTKKKSWQERFKENWEKHIKYYIVSIIVIALILGAFIAFFSTSTLDFFMKEELLVEIDPLQESMDVYYDEPVELEFEVKNNNFWFCRSQCTFRLFDPYTEKHLDTDTAIMPSNAKVKKEYSIDLGTTGHGQRLFYFDVDCHNIRSFFCKTKEPIASRSSFIAVNYDLPEDEKQVRDLLKTNLNTHVGMLAAARVHLSELRQTVDDISLVKEADQVSETYDSTIDEHLLALESVIPLWSKERYYSVDSGLKGIDVGEISSMDEELISSTSKYSELLSDYNALVDDAGSFAANRSLLTEMFRFYLSTSQEVKAHEIRLIRNIMVDKLASLEQEPIEKVAALKGSFADIKASLSDKHNQYLDDKDAFVNGSSLLVSKHTTILNTLNISTNLSADNCQAISELITTYSTINLSTNTTNTTQISLNYTDLVDFRSLSCRQATDSLQSFTVPAFNKIELSNYTRPEPTTISFDDVPANCCIFNTCAPCSVNPERYPVILLHGHSFNLDNPIEASLGIFYKMQKKMVEDGFINAGDIDSATSASGSVWSLMPYPVSV